MRGLAKKNNRENDITEEKQSVQEPEESSQETTQEVQQDPETKYKELEDKYLRLAAEYENYKRRTQREKDALYAAAVSDTVEGILPILDNLQRAAQSAQDASDVKTVAEGIAMIANSVDETFEKMGVEPIDAIGREFDASVHNAVMHVDDEGVGASIVVEEFLKGYRYKDKVIRHSMVKVAN